MQSKETPTEITIAELAPQDESPDAKKAGRPLPTSEIFQAIVCIAGRFTAQAGDLQSGLLTTPDGIQFPLSFSFGKTKLWERLLQKYGEIAPEQPFPAQAIVWIAYPKLLENTLSLTAIGIRSDRHSLEPEQLKVQGVVIAKSEDEFCLRVYRNLGKVSPSHLTDYSDLKVRGQLPQKAKLGWTYRVIAHREGVEFVADTVEPIYIRFEWQVRKAIAQVLKPSPPPAPPTLRISAGIEPQVTPTSAKEGALKDKEPIALPMVPPVETGEPEPVTEEPKLEPIIDTKPSEPAPAAQSQKKKQATAPTPAAKVPPEKKPEAAQRPKPKFLVQVDRQTFGGQSSVALKTGMLFIDGKQVVRTKLAIVVGEAQTISADGKTQTSGNRTILSSR